MSFARPFAAAALTLLVSSHPSHANEEDITLGADDEACDMQQTLLQTQFKLGRGVAAAVDPAEEKALAGERSILKVAVPTKDVDKSVEALASADLLIPKRVVLTEGSGSLNVATDVGEASPSSVNEFAVEKAAVQTAAPVEHPTLAQAADQLAEAAAAVEAAANAEQPTMIQVTEQLAEASALLGRASSALRRQEACGLAVETSENVHVAHLVPANGLICYQGTQLEMDRVFCLLQSAPTRALYPGSSVEAGSCASRGFDHLEHDPDDCWVHSQKWLRSNTDDLDRWKDAQEAVWHQYNDAEGIEDFMDLRGGMALSGCICLPGSDVMSAMGDMCAEVESLGLLPLPPLP